MSETTSPDLHRSRSPRPPRSHWLPRRFPPRRSSWAATAREILPSASSPFFGAYRLLLRVLRFRAGGVDLSFPIREAVASPMIQTPASGTCFLAGYFSHQNVYGHSFPSALSFSLLPLFPPFLSRNKAARGPTGFLDGA